MPPAFDITSQTKLANIFEAYPSLGEALFAHYHIGNCGCCGFEENETLAAYCERKGSLDLHAVLDFIQQHLTTEPLLNSGDLL